MPGVPDFYQGTEFWDLSLVDPDNRRPVDFAARAAALASHGKSGLGRVSRGIGRTAKSSWPGPAICSKLRTELADVFAHGDYQPLEVSGPHRDHVIAFARRRGRDAAIVAVAKSFAAVLAGRPGLAARRSF